MEKEQMNRNFIDLKSGRRNTQEMRFRVEEYQNKT